MTELIFSITGLVLVAVAGLIWAFLPCFDFWKRYTTKRRLRKELRRMRRDKQKFEHWAARAYLSEKRPPATRYK